MAASVVVVIGLFSFQESLLTRTYTTAYGETRRLTLADGSTVMLNANSSLTLPRFGFGTKSREVHLTGEALFSVMHTATNQRFVVRTDNGLSRPGPEVVVLGTEFTVFARPRGTKVVLNRGKVEVRYQQPNRPAEQVEMKPGDVVALSPRGELQQHHTAQPPTNPAWTEHRFVFDQTPLTEVVAMLDENYGLAVDIGDAETGQLTLTGAYPAQNADELMRIIAEVLNLGITRQSRPGQADKIILEQKPLQ